MSVNLSDAPHGMVHQGLSFMGDRVTADHWQNNVINDSVARKVVEAALRGEVVSGVVAFDDILEREVNYTVRWCELAEWSFPGNDTIEKALHQIEGQRPVTAHDRFVIGKLGLPELFGFFYGFNDARKTEGKPQLKLVQDVRREWWRTDKAVTSTPTTTGVFTWNLSDTMRATDLAGRPCYLTDTEQDEWCIEQGGTGRASVEQDTFLFQRHLLETGLPMWSGSIRGKNPCGAGFSLNVRWGADDGFRVNSWDRSDRRWNLGAVPEVFKALDA